VVVHDLNVVCIVTAPSETDPQLVVDPDAGLASAITAQPFQTVARGHPKIVQLGRSIQHPELSQSHLLRPRSESASGPPVEETFCVSVPEALDHSR
jgi:hypothetical protein